MRGSFRIGMKMGRGRRPANPAGLRSSSGRVAAALLLCASVLISPNIAAAQLRPCPSCERRLELSPAEWACLESQLGYYVGRSVEPFRIATIGCRPLRRIETPPDTQVRPTERRGHRSTSVTLSRGQLICIRNELVALEARRRPPLGARGEVVDLVRLCGPPTIGVRP